MPAPPWNSTAAGPVLLRGRGTGRCMETVATVCGYCGVGMDLHVADGAVTKATGRPDHPANRGRLCTNGNTTADMLRAGGRLTTALVRPERAAEAVPTGVDTAIELVPGRRWGVPDAAG